MNSRHCRAAREGKPGSRRRSGLQIKSMNSFIDPTTAFYFPSHQRSFPFFVLEGLLGSLGTSEFHSAPRSPGTRSPGLGRSSSPALLWPGSDCPKPRREFSPLLCTARLPPGAPHRTPATSCPMSSAWASPGQSHRPLSVAVTGWSPTHSGARSFPIPSFIHSCAHRTR